MSVGLIKTEKKAFYCSDLGARTSAPNAEAPDIVAAFVSALDRFGDQIVAREHREDPQILRDF